MPTRTGRKAAMYLDATRTKISCAIPDARVVTTPNEALGSSMSISRRSSLKRLTVTPLSTVEWKDIGAFDTVSARESWKVIPARLMMLIRICQIPIPMEMTAPFGGFKHSGIGRENGVHGLEAHLEAKAMMG